MCSPTLPKATQGEKTIARLDHIRYSKGPLPTAELRRELQVIVLAFCAHSLLAIARQTVICSHYTLSATLNDKYMFEADKQHVMPNICMMWTERSRFLLALIHSQMLNALQPRSQPMLLQHTLNTVARSGRFLGMLRYQVT